MMSMFGRVLAGAALGSTLLMSGAAAAYSVFWVDRSAPSVEQELRAFTNALLLRSASFPACQPNANGQPVFDPATYEAEDFWSAYGSANTRGQVFRCLVNSGLLHLQQRNTDMPTPVVAPEFVTRWSLESNNIAVEGSPDHPFDGFRDALRELGPLYYLTETQRDFMLNLGRSGARVPDLEIDTLGGVWLGRCSTAVGDPLTDVAMRQNIYRMIEGNFPAFLARIVGGALEARSGRQISESDLGGFDNFALSGKYESEVGLALWPSAMIANAASQTGALDRIAPFMDGMLAQGDKFTKSVADVVGDAIVYGRITGPYPLRNADISFYHGLHAALGEASDRENAIVGARRHFFAGDNAATDGFWAVYLPCRSLQDLIELPLVMEIRGDGDRSGADVYYPLPIVHPEAGVVRENTDFNHATDFFPSSIRASVIIDGNIGGGWSRASLQVYLENAVVSDVSGRVLYRLRNNDFSMNLVRDTAEVEAALAEQFADPDK